MTVLVGNKPGSGGGGGGGGGDASAANQITGNNLLNSIDTKVATEVTAASQLEQLEALIATIGEVTASPNGQTQLGRLKAIADLLVAQMNNLASMHTENQTDFNAMVSSLTNIISSLGDAVSTPAANTIHARLSAISTYLFSIRDSVKSPQFSTVSISTVTTSSTGSNFTAFGSFSCTALDITNDTGVDIEYQRSNGGTTTAFPILAGTSRLIVGVSNANQILVRRSDQLGTPVVVKAERMVL